MGCVMQRYLWKGRIREGKRDAYIERHNNIWPEMTQMLNEAGVHNYSIWLIGDELIGYYECEDVDFANRYQADSLINQKWDTFMADVMYMETDPATGCEVVCEEVFYHP